MAKISLRNYNRLIENLIENGQQDEAIAHCRHILQTFSKYLEAYRLLGKAYLEAKRYNEAVDVFQRVLMSVPDDFVSHVGLSIIADDQSKLDEAIWHMERAFETQPSNAAIQGELQRLFGRRDGVEPPKIRLTRGALAHMYVQGELYTQAISEIRAVLANDPQRIDMQVLLAKVHYHMGQKADATDACSQLLRRYPYCLDANRIMVEILPSTQRAESTQVYRQRVIELEPYSAFVQDSVFHSDQVADAAVSLEQLEYKSQAVEIGENWKGSLGIGLATDVTAVASSSSQPTWLKQPTVPASSQDQDNEAAPVAQAQQPIPDFLRQAGWGESSGAFQESQAAAADEAEAASVIQADLPDWVKAMAPAASDTTPPAAPSNASAPLPPAMDVPDWLRGLDKSQPAESAPSMQTPQPVPSTDDLPGWLENLEKGQPAAQTSRPQTVINPPTPASPVQTPKPTLSSSDLPDWLQNLDKSQPAAQPPQPQTVINPPTPAPVQPQPVVTPQNQTPVQQQPPAVQQPTANQSAVAATNADPLGGLGKSVQEQDDAMAWLESLAAKHGAKAEELVTDPNARTDVAPDWVDKAKTISETPATVTSVPASSETPAAAPAQAVEQISIESSDDETGIWLRNLESNEAAAFDAKKDQPESAPVPEPSDWMSGLSDQNAYSQISSEPAEAGEDTPILGAQDTPDWLREIERPVQPESAAPGSEAPVDLPAWLAGLDDEQPATPSGTPADELPAWLGGEAEPPIAEPTQPMSWHPVEAESPAAEPTQIDEWSVAVEPPAPVRVPTREINFEVEQPRPAKRSAPKSSTKPARKPEAAISLESAQSEMGRGNIGAAIEVYGKLIRKGKSLEEIIRDLRDALYRYPVEVPLWQALGDAYMHSNRLQEALDAYTKAEELLR